MIKFIFYIISVTLFINKNLLFSIEPPKKLIIKDLLKSESSLIVEINDRIALHYQGWLFDKSIDTENYCDAKGKKFDSTKEKPYRTEPFRPFIFVIGKGLVIPGWELGLLKMKKGSKRCLVIPNQLAYSHRSFDDIIPAYSTLIFEVHLIEVYKNKDDN